MDIRNPGPVKAHNLRKLNCWNNTKGKPKATSEWFSFIRKAFGLGTYYRVSIWNGDDLIGEISAVIRIFNRCTAATTIEDPNDGTYFSDEVISVPDRDSVVSAQPKCLSYETKPF